MKLQITLTRVIQPVGTHGCHYVQKIQYLIILVLLILTYNDKRPLLLKNIVFFLTFSTGSICSLRNRHYWAFDASTSNIQVQKF